MTPNDKKLEDRIENRAERARDEAEDAPRSTLHTYADGSQRVGTPPFPELSPKEETSAMARGETPARMQRPQPGQPVSGVDPADVENGVTEGDTALRAQQQLTADVLSGKDPHTENPTTSSDKPALAGEDNVIRADALEQTLTPTGEATAETIEQIAASIEPSGNLDATDEEKEAAAVQIARETRGAVTAGDDGTTAKDKATTTAKTSAKAAPAKTAKK